MRVRGTLARTAVLTVLAGSAAAGVAASPARAAPVRAQASRVGGASRPLPYNVGAPHSPRLLRRLAHAPVQGPPRLSRRTAAGTTAASPVPGVDVSSYQHPNGAPIDWGAVAASGVKFAAVKATEGTYYTSPYAATDLRGAQAAGLSVIAYAFAIPNGGDNGAGDPRAADQADAILNFLAPQGGSPVLPAMPPIMLDAEYDPYTSTDHTNECYGLSQPQMQQWISGFANEITAKTGRPPII